MSGNPGEPSRPLLRRRRAGGIRAQVRGVLTATENELVRLPGMGDPVKNTTEVRRLLAQAGNGPGKPLKLSVSTRASSFYVDLATQRVMDIMQGRPLLVLALVMSAALGPSLGNVIIAIWVPIVPRAARVIRSSVLAIRETPYVEAALSFLGLGVPEAYPSWGRMLPVSAAEYAQEAPWLVLFPGTDVSLAVFGTNLLGDALRDMLDPRVRQA